MTSHNFAAYASNTLTLNLDQVPKDYVNVRTATINGHLQVAVYPERNLSLSANLPVEEKDVKKLTLIKNKHTAIFDLTQLSDFIVAQPELEKFEIKRNVYIEILATAAQNLNRPPTPKEAETAIKDKVMQMKKLHDAELHPPQPQKPTGLLVSRALKEVSGRV